jgi:hypothetical protein
MLSEFITYRPTIYSYTPTQQVVVSVYKWKRLDHAEGTHSKSEVTQTNIGSLHFVEIMNIGASEQKYFHRI